MAYGAYKDLATTTASEKVFCNIAFEIVSNPQYDGDQRWLQWFIDFLLKGKVKRERECKVD